MAARSTFTLKIIGQQEPPTPYTEKVQHSAKNIDKTLLDGVLTDTFEKLYAIDNAALGTSATESHDLQTALDRYGVALGLTDVAMLFIEHSSDSAASSISVQANASNGFTNLLATTANLTLRPGEFMLVGAFTADSLVVNGTNKVLDVINDDGAQVAHYVLSVWGRT